MKATSYFVATILALATASGSALAQKKNNQDDMRNWAQIREQSVSAQELLGGKVKNIANIVGDVSMLILDKDHSRIQYVLFEVPFPYSYYAGEDGFLNYDAIDIEDDFYTLDLTIEDANVTLPRDKLKLTRSQVDDRRVDRLIGEYVFFSGSTEAREIQDILIEPETGKVTHYVIELNPDALFDDKPRAIPAKYISIKDDGNVVANLTAKEAEKVLDIDPRYL